jgi:hypothetical protein
LHIYALHTNVLQTILALKHKEIFILVRKSSLEMHVYDDDTRDENILLYDWSSDQVITMTLTPTP